MSAVLRSSRAGEDAGVDLSRLGASRPARGYAASGKPA